MHLRSEEIDRAGEELQPQLRYAGAHLYVHALHGPDGLKANSMYAVLNANYLRVKLHDKYPVPYDCICMHEFVCQGKFEGSDVRALDVSKRLMDYGIHPPTNYFPLIVPEALLIEPTETETKATLDQFIDVMKKRSGAISGMGSKLYHTLIDTTR